jgi:hypothetical protein
MAHGMVQVLMVDVHGLCAWLTHGMVKQMLNNSTIVLYNIFSDQVVSELVDVWI